MTITNETVSDILREAGATPANDPLPPIQQAATEATAVAVRESLARVGGAITEFEKVSAGLTELRQRYKDVAFPVGTKSGMAEAIAARAALRGSRVKVEALRKDAKAPILALGRDVDARAAYIRLEILKLEEPIDDQIKAEERRVEQEREAKRIAEETRVRGLQQRLDGIKQIAIDVAGTDVDHMDGAIRTLTALQIDHTWQEFEAPARNAQTETLDKLRRMRSDQAKRDAEAAELARLRAEEDARRAQEAAAQAEARRAENERLKAEAAALAEQRKAQEAREREIAAREAALRQQEEEAATARRRQETAAAAEAEAARVMREVEAEQAKRAAEETQVMRVVESVVLSPLDVVLNALLAVRDWDVEVNALPQELAGTVQRAIEFASPENAAVEAPIPAGKPAPKRPVAQSRSQVKRLAAQLGQEDDGHPE